MSQPARDSGFTLIEVLVTILLLGLIMGFAVSGWSSWAQANEQSGTARELQSLLRQTQQRAVTEGRAMCVQFGSSSYTVWRRSCDPALGERIQGPIPTNGADTRIGSPSFKSPTDASLVPSLTFFSRGTATKGSVLITRLGSEKVYTINVEGLTGRVDLHG